MIFQRPELVKCADPFCSHGIQRISNGQQDDGFGGMSMMMPMMGMGGMGGGTSMMSNMGGGSGMMIMSSSSFSNNGREVHSSTTQARMGPGGVAEIQRQVSLLPLS